MESLWNIILKTQQGKIKWEYFPNFQRIYFSFSSGNTWGNFISANFICWKLAKYSHLFLPCWIILIIFQKVICKEKKNIYIQIYSYTIPFSITRPMNIIAIPTLQVPIHGYDHRVHEYQFIRFLFKDRQVLCYNTIC